MQFYAVDHLYEVFIANTLVQAPEIRHTHAQTHTHTHTYTHTHTHTSARIRTPNILPSVQRAEDIHFRAVSADEKWKRNGKFARVDTLVLSKIGQLIF